MSNDSRKRRMLRTLVLSRAGADDSTQNSNCDI